MYESIKAPGLLSPGALAHFDAEGAEALLYELRFLSVRQRAPAAQYIADNDLRSGWKGLGWAEPAALVPTGGKGGSAAGTAS